MKLIAIDPGYDRTGFAVITKENDRMVLLFSECFETDGGKEYNKRIVEVGTRLEKLIEKHEPDSVVIEKLFFSKNKKTALRVAEVRGLCIYEAEKRNIPVAEYTPNQIKSAVTGNGRADKKQIMRMIPHLIEIDRNKKRHDDEYDAVAIGITHLAAVRNNIPNNI